MHPTLNLRKIRIVLLFAIMLALIANFVCTPILAIYENEGEDMPGDIYLSPDDADPDEAPSTEDYRKWAQADSRWGSIRLGSNGRTVAEAGCLVTAVTKLIIQSGYRSPNEFNVATLVNWLNANGGLSSEGNLYWFKPAEMIDGFEYDGMDYNGGSTSSSSLQNRIMGYVRENRHIILTVKNYGHYIAVDNAKSLEMGCVYIMDSLNNTSTNADIPLSSRYPTVSRICLYSGNNADDSDYISKCSFSMTHLYARCKSSGACYYSLPCTVAAGEGSEVEGQIGLNAVVEVTADIVNTLGQRWHQIVTSDGRHLYIWGGQLEFIRFINDVQVESETPPSGSLPLGMWYALKENVVSRHNIARIEGRITDANSNVLCSSEVTPNVHGGFDISGTAIDAGLAFGSLPQGAYSYELVADVVCSSSMTNQTATIRRIFTSPFSTGQDALPTYTVTIVDPIAADTLLQSELIAHGFYPVLPEAPVHEGETFLLWENGTNRVYSDTVVTATYESAVTVLNGDANGDGEVTMLDALIILRYSMDDDATLYIDLEAADYNADGSVNALDALLLMRELMD